MSLIERVLNKAREAPSAAATGPVGDRRGSGLGAAVAGDDVTVEPSRALASRRADQPELLITDALLQQAGLRTSDEQQRQVLSEYRHIKRRLLKDIQDGVSNRLVLIASALPGEGKSFSSANLALTLALEPDYAVLLVDADVIKPALTRMFGLSDRRGLLDAAMDPDVDVESLVVSTNVEGLSILPAGRMDANATEHFASLRMQQVIDELLAVPNRIVVVDSLPLLLTTEARALVPLAGQVVLVVRAEQTPQQAVMQALELIGEEANVKLLLNAVVRTKAMRYMGYGHYGYDYNYGETEKGDGAR